MSDGNSESVTLSSSEHALDGLGSFIDRDYVHSLDDGAVGLACQVYCEVSLVKSVREHWFKVDSD